MAESTLAATWDELRKRVAFDRGFSTDPDSWSDDQVYIIETCLRDGARLFYKPGPAGGQPHEWSFLKPPFELTLPEGEEDIPLPADFGFLMGDLYFIDPTVSTAQPLQMRNYGQLLMRRQQCPDSSGRPDVAAIVGTDAPTATRGQRFKLMIHPIPDQEYSVEGRYSVLPSALDTTHPHPYGGAAHAQTLIYACLKASESLSGTPGPHSARFVECLAASIEHDRRVQAQMIDNEVGMYRFREENIAGRCTYNSLYS
jgi:hypothetical protein